MKLIESRVIVLLLVTIEVVTKCPRALVQANTEQHHSSARSKNISVLYSQCCFSNGYSNSLIVVTLQQSNHIVNAFMYFCYNVNIISWRSYIDWEMVGFCIVDGVLCINVSDTLITKSVAVHVYTISIIHHSSWPYEMG